jgi:hypothetical protein
LNYGKGMRVGEERGEDRKGGREVKGEGKVFI